MWSRLKTKPVPPLAPLRRKYHYVFISIGKVTLYSSWISFFKGDVVGVQGMERAIRTVNA